MTLRIRTSDGWSTFATYNKYNDAEKAGQALIQSHEAECFGIIENGVTITIEAGVWGMTVEGLAD